MKKTLAALLAASMALSLCACGGGSKPAETTAAAVESGATEAAGAADRAAGVVSRASGGRFERDGKERGEHLLA